MAHSRQRTKRSERIPQVDTPKSITALPFFCLTFSIEEFSIINIYCRTIYRHGEMRVTHRKTASAIIVVFILSSLSVIANSHLVKASGTIYIRPDGSIDPSGTPILRSENTYTFTADILGSIVVEKNDISIEGAGHILHGLMDTPGIELNSLTSVTVRNVTITDFDYGIYIESSDHITISGTTLVNNNNGIWLSSSSYNVIVGNTINTNIFEGLYVYFSSSNLIQTNLIKSNTFDGIYLLFSESNNISQNRIEDNAYGISPYYSSNNEIFHNNFVNNQISVNPNGAADIWDDGYSSGGNYWSDFNPPDIYSGPHQDETGSDKIGDIPYNIDTNNADNYPLIYPFGYVPAPDVNHDGKINILDMAKVALAFGSVPGMSNWNPYVDINQDCRINILDLVAVAINFGKQWPLP